MWISAQRVDRHTCPSTRCGVVGWLTFRERVDVLERRGEWARITQRYDAACRNGSSEYVDRGDNRCVSENGIEDNRLAEWVTFSALSSDRPADPGETATGNERPVRNSDDFAQHRRAFARAASQLIEEGRCTAADFEEMGGWMKSANEAAAPVYFTYCGGMSLENRIYLNARTGRIYQ